MINNRLTALLLGANGFLGGHIAAALSRNGWHVLRAVHIRGRRVQPDERHCDLQRIHTPAGWLDLLDGVDVVLNVAGIPPPAPMVEPRYCAPLQGFLAFNGRGMPIGRCNR